MDHYKVINQELILENQNLRYRNAELRAEIRIIRQQLIDDRIKYVNTTKIAAEMLSNFKEYINKITPVLCDSFKENNKTLETDRSFRAPLQLISENVTIRRGIKRQKFNSNCENNEIEERRKFKQQNLSLYLQDSDSEIIDFEGNNDSTLIPTQNNEENSDEIQNISDSNQFTNETVNYSNFNEKEKSDQEIENNIINSKSKINGTTDNIENRGEFLDSSNDQLFTIMEDDTELFQQNILAVERQTISEATILNMQNAPCSTPNKIITFKQKILKVRVRRLKFKNINETTLALNNISTRPKRKVNNVKSYEEPKLKIKMRNSSKK